MSFLTSLMILATLTLTLVQPSFALLVPFHTSIEGRRRHQQKEIPRRVIHPTTQTQLHSSTPTSSTTTSSYDELPKLLKRYGFGSRLTTLNNDQLSKLPMPAEMYEGGAWKLCLVTGLNNNGRGKLPLLDVVVMSKDGLLQETKTVDIGESVHVYCIFNYFASPRIGGDGCSLTRIIMHTPLKLLWYWINKSTHQHRSDYYSMA